jgi:predicted AAA+ superfamily ATPase
MPALCSGLSLRSSPEHSASPSLYLVQQAATDGPELIATSGPRLLAKLIGLHNFSDALVAGTENFLNSLPSDRVLFNNSRNRYEELRATAKP